MARVMKRLALGVPAGLLVLGSLAACDSLLGDFTDSSGSVGGADSSVPPEDSSAATDARAETTPGNDAGAEATTGGDGMAGGDGTTTVPDASTDAPSCTFDGGDPLNCGACGHSCQGGLCVANQCQPFSMSGPTTDPVTIAANETKVFWRLANGTLMSEPVTGATSGTNFYVSGDANTYCGSGASLGCANISLDPTTAYWPDLPSNGPIIQSQTVGGVSAFAFGTLQSHINEYTYVVQDGTALFAANYDEVVQAGGCPTSGVDTMTIQPRSNTSTTWTNGAFCWIERMAVDATNLYWTDRGPPNGESQPGVFLAAKLGTTSTKIASASNPIGIAVYADTVYWTDNGTGGVMRWPLGGQVSTLSSSLSPTELAVDASGVYWIDSGTTILHAPLIGTSVQPSTLAHGQTSANSITTNSVSIFWTNAGTSGNSYDDGAVMKLAK